MVTIEFLDPTGRIEVKQRHANRIASLEGKRIGFISNDMWQAHRMLPMLKEMLETEVGAAEVLAVDAFPRGNAVIGSANVAALVEAADVDAVIIGNAA